MAAKWSFSFTEEEKLILGMFRTASKVEMLRELRKILDDDSAEMEIRDIIMSMSEKISALSQSEYYRALSESSLLE